MPKEANNYSWFNSSTFHPSYHTNKKAYFLILVSHVANFIPIFFAILKNLPTWFIYLLLLQTLFSLLYHSFFKNKILQITDYAFATLLIIANIFILLSSTKFLSIKILIILFLLGLTTRPYLSYKNYAHNHSFWHLIAALITTAAIW